MKFQGEPYGYGKHDARTLAITAGKHVPYAGNGFRVAQKRYVFSRSDALGFESYEMGYASAMAWILLVVVLVLTVAVLRGSRSLVHYEGLKA